MCFLDTQKILTLQQSLHLSKVPLPAVARKFRVYYWKKKKNCIQNYLQCSFQSKIKLTYYLFLYKQQGLYFYTERHELLASWGLDSCQDITDDPNHLVSNAKHHYKQMHWSCFLVFGPRVQWQKGPPLSIPATHFHLNELPLNHIKLPTLEKCSAVIRVRIPVPRAFINTCIQAKIPSFTFHLVSTCA